MPGKQYTESNKKYNIQYNWILGILSNLGLQSSLGDDSPGVADGKLWAAAAASIDSSGLALSHGSL